MKSQQAIIFFLWKEGINATEIAHRLKAVFGDTAESVHTVQRWIKRSENGRQSLEDDHLIGWLAMAVNEEKVRAVEAVLIEDRRATVREISDHIGIGLHQVFENLQDRLQMSKVSVRWVPRLLGPQQKRDRVVASQELLYLVEEYGDNFWCRIITPDEV